MAEVIKNEGYSVVASDLVDRGYGQGGVDFLTADFPVGKYYMHIHDVYGEAGELKCLWAIY